MKTSRLIDSFFIEFICDSKSTVEFETMKSFLGKDQLDIDGLLKNFYVAEVSKQSSPKKSLPKSPSSPPKKRKPIRRSFENSLILEESEISIPSFYPISKPPKQSFLKSLQPEDSFLKVSTLGNILQQHLNLPKFFALPFMTRLDPNILKTKNFTIKFSTFLDFAIPRLEGATLPERVFRIILGKNDRDYLLQTDFVPFIIALLKSHKSLKFLEEDTSLQSPYTKCIIAQIFYALDPECRGRITLPRIANSNFCDCLISVDKAEDVSDVSDFFSYEHFYVFFSKFWTIDVDETGKPTVEQLADYDENRISLTLIKRFIQRIPVQNDPGFIDFTSFCYFMQAVEDKSSETALRLWYHVCDLDDDGILSISEIKRLYHAQKKRMSESGMDPVDFKYVLSQIIDMVGDPGQGITLNALRESRQYETFFNILVDFKKFSEWEFRDPMFEMKLNAAFEGMKQFDVFCQREYARLSSEND